MAMAVRLLLAVPRAVAELAGEALLGERLLRRDRLTVSSRGVDPHHLLSSKGATLKAFADGSVLESGACGIAVFYSEGHPHNYHGGFLPIPRASSNLVELLALFWAVLHHPRGQHLSVFSDSAHALRLVEKAACATEKQQPNTRARRRPPPPSEPREACLVRAIHWLLRLRKAQTCFFKVPAHKKYKQNEIADALAQQAASEPPSLEAPFSLGWARLLQLLLIYILRQDPLDGGALPPRLKAGRKPKQAVRRPQPIGKSTEMTRVSLLRLPRSQSESRAHSLPPQVLALDCEMVGVGAMGMDSCLASVGVVNAWGQQVFFSYAKTSKKITDYRTRYSGITPELLKVRDPSEAHNSSPASPFSSSGPQHKDVHPCVGSQHMTRY